MTWGGGWRVHPEAVSVVGNGVCCVLGCVGSVKHMYTPVYMSRYDNIPQPTHTHT